MTVTCEDGDVSSELNYQVVGSTRPSEETWAQQPAGYRRYARTVCVGHGADRWEAVAEAVLDWQVKTRSGFAVEATTGPRRVQLGADYKLIAKIGPVTVCEPVRVVDVVDQPTRRGFAYGTLFGHPVSGEEAFIAHRSLDRRVWLTLRSLTRASRGAWGLAFPALLVAQRYYRHRYMAALRHRD
jgi:uncharacterized protein (UPF0548 family)